MPKWQAPPIMRLVKFHALQCLDNRWELANLGVKRQGNGNALVTVTHNNGKKRIIIFQNGRANGYDQSQADHPKFSSSKDSDLNIIKIGSERYEIPDAVEIGRAHV